MNKLSFVILVVLLQTLPLTAQSQEKQAEVYGFQDIHLGMSIAEFKTKHPAPKVEKYGPSASPLPGEASCSSLAESVLRCDYGTKFLHISLRMSALFVDGEVAMIEVQPPDDTGGCFEPVPASGSARYFYMGICPEYSQLWQSLISNLGPASPLVSTRENYRNLRVERWQDETAVAEFQEHWCGPSSPYYSNALGERVLEVLDGRYCEAGDVFSARETTMIYLWKEFGRKAAMRLRERQPSASRQ